jgi:hypothetical protein
MWERWFLVHPRSVGESYAEHFAMAARFGAALIAAGIACLVHAVVPALCTSTASREVARLHDVLVVSRSRRRMPEGHEAVRSAEASSYVI